jgi:riboflavin biosynthesis pyrimidine reductase
MSVKAEPDRPPADQRPPVFSRLLPPGAPATAEQIVADLELGDLGAITVGRPHVMLNMVSTADGRVTLGGRSGPIGNRADREHFHALRGAVDAVMVGAGTLRVERYGRIIPEESRRRLRQEQGLSEEPLACIVSAGLSSLADSPLLAEPAARVVIVTPSRSSLPVGGAHLDYIRTQPEEPLDLRSALKQLHDRFGVRTLLCEGGPHLNSELLAAGLVDELFLSLSPKLAGGEEMNGDPPLRILAGAELDPPVELELLAVAESDSQLFLRYGVRASAPERVS